MWTTQLHNIAMAGNFIEGIEEKEDENGMRIRAFRIGNGKKENLLKRIMFDGIQIVSGAALAAYTWKSNFHPIWPVGFFGMTLEGAVHFYKNMQESFRVFRWLPYTRRERIWSSAFLVSGTITYFASVVAFSRALKQNNKLWMAHLGVAAAGYYVAVSSNYRLARTFLTWNRVYKCYQLLFGPTLIGSASYCLLSLQKHDEKWLRCLPLIALATVVIHISLIGYRKFQGCREIEEPIFECICGMVCGPIIFCSVCLAVKCVDHPIMLLDGFLFLIGIGFAVLGNSIWELYQIVPLPVFSTYCQWVLGPVVTVYSSLCSAYIGYSMGWRFSLVMLPFIPAGIYASFKYWE